MRARVLRVLRMLCAYGVYIYVCMRVYIGVCACSAYIGVLARRVSCLCAMRALHMRSARACAASYRRERRFFAFSRVLACRDI